MAHRRLIAQLGRGLATWARRARVCGCRRPNGASVGRTRSESNALATRRAESDRGDATQEKRPRKGVWPRSAPCVRAARHLRPRLTHPHLWGPSTRSKARESRQRREGVGRGHPALVWEEAPRRGTRGARRAESTRALQASRAKPFQYAHDASRSRAERRKSAQRLRAARGGQHKGTRQRHKSPPTHRPLAAGRVGAGSACSGTGRLRCAHGHTPSARGTPGARACTTLPARTSAATQCQSGVSTRDIPPPCRGLAPFGGHLLWATPLTPPQS